MQYLILFLMYNETTVGSYYYVKDKNSENGSTPIPEDEYIQVIFRIAKKHELNITDKMILEELNQINEKKARIK